MENKTIKLICNQFKKEYFEIIRKGRLAGLAEPTIEKAQQAYLEALVFFLIDKSGLSLKNKKQVLTHVKNKILRVDLNR